jgi:hypothetical protein
MASASSDIKSLVRWITVRQSIIAINTLGLSQRQRCTMKWRIQVDSLGTVLSIREGLYTSQPCLSICTKGLCVWSVRWSMHDNAIFYQ